MRFADCLRRRTRLICLAIAGVIAFGGFAIQRAPAHETDQFSLPYDREFADWGPLLNRWMFEQIRDGVDQQNAKIRAAIEQHKSAEVIAQLQSPDEITKSVWSQYPVAYNLIQNLEKLCKDKDLAKRFPGQVVGDRPAYHNIREHFEIPYNPFRPWYANTIKVYDVYLGTDKIGHFADMGMHYWRNYKKALAEGKNEHDAMIDCYQIATHGLIFSERGLMGYVTALAYSNADLVGNFMGFLFYRNLTEEIELKGAQRTPMLFRDGDYWAIAQHVRRDSDFFSLFVSDAMNEALNPSLYVALVRSRLAMGVKERAAKVLQRHADRHGNRRPPGWFFDREKEFETLCGLDYGHFGDVKELVFIANTCFEPFDENANVRSRDNLGLTPLHRAAWEGRTESVKKLLERGAPVDARVRSNEPVNADWGSTPLELAASQGHDDCVKLLLDAGADVNARDDRGVSALHRACDYPATIELLLSRGTDPRARDAHGHTPLQWACDAPGDVYEGEPHDPTKAVELLIKAGADVNAADEDGVTPLLAAAGAGNQAGVKALLAHGAKLDATDRFGNTPLHTAAAHKTMPFLSTHIEAVVADLLKAGADVSAKNSFGRTPLHEAAKFSNLAIVEALLAANANVNAADDFANTPLHLACRGGRQEITQALLQKGASRHAKNAAGHAAMNEAVASKNEWLVAMLKAHATTSPMAGGAK